MKFCICFFGVIGRSLKYTFQSIQLNILEVLKENNIDYDIYIHNNYIENLTCPRAEESNCKINNLIYKQLNPIKFSETKQMDFDKSYNWQQIFKNGDGHRDGFNSIMNAIRELYSVKQVTQLWESNDENYDFFIYLRPDLLYINKLDIELILQNLHIKNVLFTPNWDKFYGLNDRIYFGNKDTILKIAKRIDFIPELISQTNIVYNAEHYMKLVVKKFNISTIDIMLKGLRVRADGRIQETGQILQ